MISGSTSSSTQSWLEEVSLRVGEEAEKPEGERRGRARPLHCQFSFFYCCFSSPVLTAAAPADGWEWKEIKEKRQKPILLPLRGLIYLFLLLLIPFFSLYFISAHLINTF